MQRESILSGGYLILEKMKRSRARGGVYIYTYVYGLLAIWIIL